MQYVGGKFRQRRDFVPAILADTPNRERYLEPFVGGGAMLERMAPNFKSARASDVHEDLILMYQALLAGWEPPEEVNEKEYAELKFAEPSALRGFVGFACSFGAKWFGGYARNKTGKSYAGTSKRNLAKMLPLVEHVGFHHTSYDFWKPSAGTVVYADPPYANVGVGYKDSAGFDHPAFWNKMDEWTDRGALVYVSEFSAPPHWEPIAESVQRLTIAGNSPVTAREQGLQHDRLWKRTKLNG